MSKRQGTNGTSTMFYLGGSPRYQLQTTANLEVVSLESQRMGVALDHMSVLPSLTTVDGTLIMARESSDDEAAALQRLSESLLDLGYEVVGPM